MDTMAGAVACILWLRDTSLRMKAKEEKTERCPSSCETAYHRKRTCEKSTPLLFHPCFIWVFRSMQQNWIPIDRLIHVRKEETATTKMLSPPSFSSSFATMCFKESESSVSSSVRHWVIGVHLTVFVVRIKCDPEAYRTGWRAPKVAPSVKRPTLDFGSGHDLMVCGFEPHVGLCADSTEPAWDALSPSLSAPPLLPRSSSK